MARSTSLRAIFLLRQFTRVEPNPWKRPHRAGTILSESTLPLVLL